MRIRLAAALLIALGALLVAPSTASDREIRATFQNTWQPSQVTIGVGDTVTFRNTGGEHNLVFEDGERLKHQPSTDSWSEDRTFESVGTFGFYCEPHRGVGMVGSVRVVDPDAATPTPVQLAIRRALRVGSRLSFLGIVDRRLAGARVELLVGDGRSLLGRAGLRVDERGRVGASGTLPARAARARTLLVGLRTPRSDELLRQTEIARTARRSPGLAAQSGSRTATSLTVSGRVAAELQSRVVMTVRYLDNLNQPRRARAIAERLSNRWRATVQLPPNAQAGIVTVSTRGDLGRYGQGISARLPGS